MVVPQRKIGVLLPEEGVDAGQAEAVAPSPPFCNMFLLTPCEEMA